MSGLFQLLWYVGLSSVAPHRCRRILDGALGSGGGRKGSEEGAGGSCFLPRHCSIPGSLPLPWKGSHKLHPILRLNL